MNDYTIIFDVDGVIIDSWSQKDKIIEDVLDKYELLHLHWVSDILNAWLNRILLLERIYELKKFNFEEVLQDMNISLRKLESSVVLIEDTAEFIKKNFSKYNFFTNTSMPKDKLKAIFSHLDFWKYFIELLAYEDGAKRENIDYVLKTFNLQPEKTLFIDDKQVHIDAVKSTGVHTLLYRQDWVSLQEKLRLF